MLVVKEEGSEQRVMKSSAAANKLGISKSRLNRLAPIYEQLYGELPRGGRNVRFWPLEAIERIRKARLAVGEGRAVNMEAALRGFETPEETTPEETQSSQMPARISGEMPDTQAPPRALEGLAGELHALREAVEDQNKLLSMLLRVEAHRLKRLEADSPLPVATADTSEKASLESAGGTMSSAENQKDGEDARQPSTSHRTSTSHRISMWVFPIMLPIPPILVTVMSALMMDALLFVASLVVTAVTILAGWYYYFSWNDYRYSKTGRRTDELAEVGAQENEQMGHRDRG
jgi:hypothetical protein